MGEVKSVIEDLLKTKMVVYLIVLAGFAFFFTGMADLSYYVVNIDGTYFSEPAVTTVLFLIRDAVCIVAAVGIWVISAKVLRAKCC